MLVVGDGLVHVTREADPAALPWSKLGVDVVIEATGRFRTRAGAARHCAPERTRSSSRRRPRATSPPMPPWYWA